jgi:hypothetical protein
MSEVFGNGKNTMTVLGREEFKRDRSRVLHGILDAVGKAEAAVTAEGDKFETVAAGATIHGTAKSGIATINHFVHVFITDLCGCNV